MKKLLVFVLALIGLFVCAASAHAVTFTPLPDLSDQDFRDLKLIEKFVVEGRIGNTGDWEMGIWKGFPSNSDVVNKQFNGFNTKNGMAYDFRIVNIAGSSLDFEVRDGDEWCTVSRNDLNTDADSFLLRTRSNGDGSVMEISNLIVDGDAYGTSLISNDADTVEYLRIDDVVDESFILTGTSSMSWITTTPPTAPGWPFS